MATRTSTRTRKRPDAGALRDEWLRAIHELADQISAWAREEPGWETSTATAEVEDDLGIYTVPTVTIQTPDGRLILEPGRYTSGRKAGDGLRGSVELYAWPTLFRVRLLYGQPEVKWQVMTESRVPLRQEWNRANFIRLAQDLVGAEL